jgi:hypothetical protein
MYSTTNTNLSHIYVDTTFNSTIKAHPVPLPRLCCPFTPFTRKTSQGSLHSLVLVPYRRSRKGLIVYLWSVDLFVCLSFHFQFSGLLKFSLQWMKIFNWNLIYNYISMSYRPSLSFVMLEQLLTGLFPLMFTFSFPDFFLLNITEDSGFWNFLYGFLLNGYISSSSLGTFDWIMALEKLQYSVVWLITRKLFGLELSNLVFWCILIKVTVTYD